MALKLSSTASRNARASSGWGTSASVVMKPSIVAIIGSIIPEPLAIPPIRTVRPPIWISAAASLGNGSVVMMARAAADPWSLASPRNAAGSAARILSIGSATPITPVDATRTSATEHPTSRAVSAAMSRAARNPSSPVQALAHPLLTTIARATPPLALRCSRETRIGAASARFVVKTAAAVAGVSDTSRARSRPCLALMPALEPEARYPCGVVTPPMPTVAPAIRRTGRRRPAGDWPARGRRRRPIRRLPERRRSARPSRTARTCGRAGT